MPHFRENLSLKRAETGMRGCVALYMRLSREDLGGEKNEKESAGIESQRLLLRRFAEERGFFVAEEYVDDGYSGTSYDRPAFLRMREDIEAGRISVVLVKDLSRLGRNYIATGELTEVYFPKHRVRLIAVNDGYDSAEETDDLAPFRHVMNEMYARDISRKIRSALRAKSMAGQYIGSFAPYGYRKSEADHNRLVIDGEAAKVVSAIFRQSAEGRSTREIAEELNDRGIPIPLDYRKIKEGCESEGRKWTSSGVCKILRNRVYLGHTIQGKSRKISFKAKGSISVEREAWIVVPDTHPPLVSKEEFALAQRKKGKTEQSLSKQTIMVKKD